MYRQGDVLITQIDQLPEGLKTKKDMILVYGEITGHSHRLVGGSVFEDPKGILYLMVAKKGEIVHEEHKTIHLKKGVYMVKRQREYTRGNMTRLVID